MLSLCKPKKWCFQWKKEKENVSSLALILRFKKTMIEQGKMNIWAALFDYTRLGNRRNDDGELCVQTVWVILKMWEFSWVKFLKIFINYFLYLKFSIVIFYVILVIFGGSQLIMIFWKFKLFDCVVWYGKNAHSPKQMIIRTTTCL